MSLEEVAKFRTRDKKVPCQCEECGNTFLATRCKVEMLIRKQNGGTNKIKCTLQFCTRKCSARNKERSKIYPPSVKREYICSLPECGKTFLQYPSHYNRKNKISDQPFCSISCAGHYYWEQNLSKVKKSNRSNLERYLESQLIKSYPNLNIMFNTRAIIDRAELDIYIPSLKLAFELNGPVHYEPIYGEEELKKRQNNDDRKFQVCLEKSIELCVFNTTQSGRFNEKIGEYYFDIIEDIINQKNERIKAETRIDIIAPGSALKFS